MIPLLPAMRISGRAASATTVATGDESSRNPWIIGAASEPRSGDMGRAVVTLLRSLFVLLFCPWVPRGLVTHGYCCFGATRLFMRESEGATESARRHRRRAREERERELPLTPTG